MDIKLLAGGAVAFAAVEHCAGLDAVVERDLVTAGFEHPPQADLVGRPPVAGIVVELPAGVEAGDWVVEQRGRKILNFPGSSLLVYEPVVANMALQNHQLIEHFVEAVQGQEWVTQVIDEAHAENDVKLPQILRIELID